MLLHGSNRLPANYGESFEDNFERDAMILIELIKKHTENEDASKDEAKDTNSTT